MAAPLVMLDLKKNMSRECSDCWLCSLRGCVLCIYCRLPITNGVFWSTLSMVHAEHNVQALGLPHLHPRCRNPGAGPHSKPAKKGCCGGQSAVKHENNTGYQQAPVQGQPVQGYPVQQQQTVGQLPPGKVV